LLASVAWISPVKAVACAMSGMPSALAAVAAAEKAEPYGHDGPPEDDGEHRSPQMNRARS
jgi:hypothetical protein